MDDWLTDRAEGPLVGVPRDSLEVTPGSGPIDCDIRPPGSKSITNRALVCAALSPRSTELHGVLFADDTVAMIRCLGGLGVRISPGDDVDGVVVDPPPSGTVVDDAVLDAALSGTTARFIMPVAALLSRSARLDGREPLRRRPMGDLIGAMTGLGARIVTGGDPDGLPLTIRRGDLRGGRVALPGDVSSQFLSALMLVGPALNGGLTVRLTTPLVSRPYVEMTAAVMGSFGAVVDWDDDEIVVSGAYTNPDRYVVEPDASAASYFLAAAALRGGRTRIDGLGTGSLQGDIGFADVLGAMGMEVEWGDDWVRVTSTGTLGGVEVDMVDMSDVAQTLAVVATAADSPTEVTGIGFIRAKETDRIAAVVTELRRLGVEAVENADGFTIHPGQPRPGLVRTYDDHRMAMSFAVLGLVHQGITIADPHCVSKTYPGFWRDLARI